MANHLNNIQGTSQSTQVGTQFPLQVVVQAVDAANNPRPGIPLVWTTPGSSPSGTFSNGTHTINSTTDSSGYGFSGPILAGGTPGGWTGAVQIVAEPTVSAFFSFSNSATPANALAITAGTNQQAAQNSVYAPISATVYDAGGNGLAGFSVRFSVPAGHGTFPGGLTTVDVNSGGDGVATAPTFTANATLGAFTVTVTLPSSPTIPAQTTTWTTVDPALPSTVQANTGGGQQAAISTAFTKALKAKVTNILGAPVAGVTVTFTSPSSGASCTFPTTSATAVSDASGFASSPVPTANALTGSYFVTATVPGATAGQFQLTNGTAFLPEVCSPAAAPTQAVNVGSNTTDWINLSNAFNGSTTGSVLATAGGGITNKFLFVSALAAAALAAMDDAAKITKFIATFDYKVTGGTQNFVTKFKDGGSTASLTNVNTTNGGANVWTANTATFPVQGTRTGAQIKAGNYGISFEPSGYATAFTFSIRNVTLSICYQNPATPATAIAVPMQFCEA